MPDRTTLWGAIERQRLRTAGLIGTLLIIWLVGASVAGVLALAGIDALGVSIPQVSLSARLAAMQAGLPLNAAVSALAALVVGVIHVAVTSRRSVLPLLISLGARPVGREEHASLVSALNDMALAAGVRPVPTLYVIDDHRAINAFVLWRRHHPAVIVVTSGLVERCDVSLQRVVFANLVSRVTSGGAVWATDLFRIMSPIRGVVTRLDGLRARALDNSSSISLVWIFFFAVGLFEILTGRLGINVVSWGLFLTTLAASFVCIGVTLHSLDFAYLGAYRRMVLSSDADSVMLLKDPEQAVAALKAVLSEPTWIVGGWRLLYMSYVEADLPRVFWQASDLDDTRLAHLSVLAFPAQRDTIRPLPILGVSQIHARGSDA